MKKLIAFFVIGLVLLGGILAYGAYRAALKPNVKESFDLYIDEQSSFEEILSVYGSHFSNLEDFQKIAEWKGLPDNLKLGRYYLEEGMSANAVVNRLKAGNQKPVRVTINFATDLESLSRVLSQQLMADSISFSDYFNSTAFKEDYQLQNSEALGFFIPNTYELYWTTSPEQFAQRMQKENQRFWSQRESLLQQSGLSKKEVLSLASIVESETARFEEMPKVARLYLNRLEQNILLQSDPTVIYAWQKVHPKDKIKRVLYKHLEIDSPYNTYKYPGLPPGPIRIVSPQAIDAVLKADKHNYIFMCADPERPGYHAFARNLRQHNVNRQRYIRWLEEQNRIARSRK